MTKSISVAAALLAAIQRLGVAHGPAVPVKPGPSNVTKFSPVTRRAKVCSPDCYVQSADLPDGSTAKEVVHVVNCARALAIHNQGVNTRQVRRAYERTMKKRGALDA